MGGSHVAKAMGTRTRNWTNGRENRSTECRTYAKMIGVTGNSPVDGVMRVYRGKWGEMGTYSMIKSTIYNICIVEKTILLFFWCRCDFPPMLCSDVTEKCRDSSSKEQINVDVAPPRRQPTTRRPPNMDMYYTKKGPGGSGGSKGCPGSLDDCMGACPSNNVRAFRACAATCSRWCSKK